MAKGGARPKEQKKQEMPVPRMDEDSSSTAKSPSSRSNEATDQDTPEMASPSPPDQDTSEMASPSPPVQDTPEMASPSPPDQEAPANIQDNFDPEVSEDFCEDCAQGCEDYICHCFEDSTCPCCKIRCKFFKKICELMTDCKKPAFITFIAAATVLLLTVYVFSDKEHWFFWEVFYTCSLVMYCCYIIGTCERGERARSFWRVYQERRRRSSGTKEEAPEPGRTEGAVRASHFTVQELQADVHVNQGASESRVKYTHLPVDEDDSLSRIEILK